MKLTCTRPVALKTKEGRKAFRPGDIFFCDDLKARPYIEKGLLKQVEEETNTLIEGCLIQWKSPVFGLLKGKIQMLPGDGTIIVDHPVTGELASFPVGWVKRIIEKES